MTLAQQLAASIEMVKEKKENMTNNAEVKEQKERKSPERPDVNAWLNATDEQRNQMKVIGDLFGKLPRPLKVIVRSQLNKAMEAKA